MALQFFGFRAYEPLTPFENEINFNNSNFRGRPFKTSLTFKYKERETELIECIITVNQEKNIVSTPMQGRNGTIKEYISDGDYSITVDAAVSEFFINNNGDAEKTFDKDYPKFKVKSLASFLKIGDTVEVHSEFLSLFKIESAVIKSYGMVQETHSNRQSFQIQMLSDTPYEIKIQQDATINK